MYMYMRLVAVEREIAGTENGLYSGRGAAKRCQPVKQGDEMTFGELVEALGKHLGVELGDEGGATAVEADGLPVILHAAGDDILLMHADLGEIAPEGREEISAAALEANYLYQATGGATLAVNRQDGHMHIQKYNWMERLDAEKAATELDRFVEVALAWKKILEERTPDPVARGFEQV